MNRDPNLERFIEAMRAKMQAAMQRDPTRPADPWNHYSSWHLRNRLREEYEEWRQLCLGATVEQERAELVDIANLAFFVWMVSQK